MWLVYALLAAIIWGLDYAVGEHVLQNKVSAVTLLMLQTIVGGVMFLLIGAYGGNIKKELVMIAADKSLLALTILVVVTFNIANLFIFLSIQSKNAAIAGLVELSYPLFILLFSWLLFKQNHFTPSLALGGLMIIAGVFIISYFN